MKTAEREFEKCTLDVLRVQRVRRDKGDKESAVQNLKGKGYIDDLMVNGIAILKWDLVEIDMRA